MAFSKSYPQFVILFATSSFMSARSLNFPILKFWIKPEDLYGITKLYAYIETISIFFMAFFGIFIHWIMGSLKGTCLFFAGLMTGIGIMSQIAFSGLEKGEESEHQNDEEASPINETIEMP